MFRRLALMVLVSTWLLGCKPPEPTTAIVTPETPAAVEPASLAPTTFMSWPRIPDKPFKVKSINFADCASESLMNASGPHADGFIQVRVNSESEIAFRERGTLPLGTVIVKEKFLESTTTLNSYALMTKREPGYFPDGGDWEYTFVTLNPERKVTTGKLMNCASCHHNAAKDYLFRNYIK
ncbi:MAG: cytochrome P460 family protein [Fimbriiglobus sp.]